MEFYGSNFDSRGGVSFCEGSGSYGGGAEVKIQKASGISKRTLTPLTTTTSVLGLVYDGGVALAADVGGYYGSMARFKSLDRILKVNKFTLLASSGDYADYQHLEEMIRQKIISEEILDDGFALKPHMLYSYLTRLMYARRSKFNPLWANLVIAGWNDGKPFLGATDKLGLSYTDGCIATGFGAYLAAPLMRDAVEKAGAALDKLSAHRVLTKAMEVLYYRDTRSYPKYYIANVSSEGVEISPELEIKGQWDIAAYVRHFE